MTFFGVNAGRGVNAVQRPQDELLHLFLVILDAYAAALPAGFVPNRSSLGVHRELSVHGLECLRWLGRLDDSGGREGEPLDQKSQIGATLQAPSQARSG